MSNQAIHWGEGLFLRPHHFQAAERALREEITLAEEWLEGYAYGLRELTLDEDALTNWQVVLKTCHGRFPDGTHIRFTESSDENARLAVDVPGSVFEKSSRVMVYLALPRLQLGRQNAGYANNGAGTQFRYLIDSQDIADENEEGNVQSLEVRRPNVKLALEGEEMTGYEVLPIMRLRRGSIAEAAPEIDPDYIPPVLACDAWSGLRDGIIRNIYDRISGMAERLVRQIHDRGIAFESGHREDLERMFRLYALNSALGYLWNLPFVRGVHPLKAYMELCRIVGMTSLFRSERSMPEVPRYDHDDLGRCFRAIDEALQEKSDVPQPIKRPFVGAGLQLQVQIERDWLTPSWKLYVGVESNLSLREVDNLLRGNLKMKIGSTRQVDQIFMRAKAGVELRREAEAPRALPGKNWTYWKVDEESTAWMDVEETLSLGIRLDEQQVEGKIDGQQTIVVRTQGGQEAGMSFALWVVPTQNDN